jgi:hypothetical protein
MAIFIRIFLIFVLFFAPKLAFGAVLTVAPENPIQGEPVMITVTSTSSLQSLSLNGKPLKTFWFNNSLGALYGIDLYAKTGTYYMEAKFSDGSAVQGNFNVGKREMTTAPLGIPEKLGGNTEASATKLVSTLAKENASLLNLRTGNHAFWKNKYTYPVSNPIITDEYGYGRSTGSYTIAHKGTDFRAKEGTPVLAMNRGVVRVAREGRNYGKTIVVDHGLGVQTFYMHLSKINVNVGELVLPGQVIGLSGMTGYAEQPHLHLTVRINDVSIDPVKFMALFKE